MAAGPEAPRAIVAGPYWGRDTAATPSAPPQVRAIIRPLRGRTRLTIPDSSGEIGEHDRDLLGQDLTAQMRCDPESAGDIR